MRMTLKVGLVGFVAFLFFLSILSITGASAYTPNQRISSTHFPSLLKQVKCSDCFAGWGATGPKQTITSVSDSFSVPTIKCSSDAHGAAITAIDGLSAGDFAYIGVSWICNGKSVTYQGFWFSLSTQSYGITDFSILAGDKVSVSIKESGGNFIFHLVDSTAKGELTGKSSDSGAANDAATCMTDMGDNAAGNPYPQTNFGTLNISSCLVNKTGVGNTKQTLTEYICVNSKGTKTLATPSKLSGSSLDDFTIKFVSAGP
jgi:hypothetical protein